MNDLKYITVIMQGMTTRSAILFRGCITHKEMVPDGSKAVGGGFCRLSVDGGELNALCYSEAVSLNISSDPVEDGIAVVMTLTRSHSYSIY